jgi:hypothetical protein
VGDEEQLVLAMAQSDLNLALYPGIGWELQLIGRASAPEPSPAPAAAPVAAPGPDQQPTVGTGAGAAAPSEPASE